MDNLKLGPLDHLWSIHCVSAGHQQPGHVGISSPTSSRVFKTVEDAKGWLEKHIHESYVSVVADIRIVETTKEPPTTTISHRYETLYQHDL